MNGLLDHLDCNRNKQFPQGHVLRQVDATTREKLERFLGGSVSPEYLDFLAEYGGTTIYSIPLPCPKSSSKDRLRELPFDVWNLYIFGDYTPGKNGGLHTHGLDCILRHGRSVTPVDMLPLAEHIENRFLHYSHRPESYGRLFLYCPEDLPYYNAYDPECAGQEPPDPFLACQEVAPNLETFFKNLRSFSAKEYDEWADRANSYI